MGCYNPETGTYDLKLEPQPGDFAVVSAGGLVGELIELGEWLNGKGFEQYQHALIYAGNGRVIEAKPNGVTLDAMRPRRRVLWSTGRIELDAHQRMKVLEAAKGYIGTPYSFLDYLALAAHRLHLPFPGLKRFMASKRHMICSQLVDQCYKDAGINLFTDGRWAGYVTPADLAARLLGEEN